MMNDMYQLKSQEYYKLLEAYINICNEALKQNKHNFPFNHMWKVIKDQCKNQEINIALIDDRPDPVGALRLSDDGVRVSPSKQEDEATKGCHIKLSHIQHVLNNKEEYIKDPARINWHWIETMIENYKSPQG